MSGLAVRNVPSDCDQYARQPARRGRVRHVTAGDIDAGSESKSYSDLLG